MQVSPIPPSILHASATLLEPYAPGLTPLKLVAALESADSPSALASQPMLSTLEAGKMLGTSSFTVQRLITEGALPGRKIGGQWRIPAAAVEGLMEAEEL